MTDRPPPRHADLEIGTLLLADHRKIEALMAEFDSVAVGRRAEVFGVLLPTLVAHEVAEEEIVYPAIRAVDLGAGPTVQARIDEQSRAEERLRDMETMDPTGEAFAQAFATLRAAVLDHVQHEEQTTFRLLDQHSEALDHPTMGVRYQKAKAAAPTHPHPHAPDAPPGNVVLGPVVAMFDRVRDALR